MNNNMNDKLEILVRKPTDGEIAWMSQEVTWESDPCEFDFYYDHNETALVIQSEWKQSYRVLLQWDQQRKSADLPRTVLPPVSTALLPPT